jgi:hypothetical protein
MSDDKVIGNPIGKDAYIVELQQQIADLTRRIEQDATNWKILWQGAQEEIERLKADNENWKQSAAQFLENQRYYCGLLDEIAKNFGHEAYTSDDGSVQDSPLRAKMPELVAALQKEVEDAKTRAATSEFCCSEWKADLDKLKLANLKNAILGDADSVRTKEIWNAEIQDYAKTVEKLRCKLEGAKKALRELHAMVKGECSSLLDEDRGGTARLDIEIQKILSPTN